MLRAKSQPNWPSGSEKEVVWMLLPSVGMTPILNFGSWPVFAKSCITIIWNFIKISPVLSLKVLFEFFSWTVAMATMPCNFHKNIINVINALSSISLWKISYLAQRVHVSEILGHFPNLPHPFNVCLLSDQNNFHCLYREVPHMLPAKFPPNWPSGSGEEVVWMIFTIYGHDGHLEFWIITCFC